MKMFRPCLGHCPLGVQHDGLVVAQAHHLALCEHGIHILAEILALLMVWLGDRARKWTDGANACLRASAPR